MPNETDFPTEQSYDSLAPEDSQSSDALSKQIEELTRQNQELNSRLGQAVQRSGEERKALEEQYSQWASNVQSWYKEQLDDKDSTIKALEDKLIDAADNEGAKVVLAERRAREERDSAAQATRQESERMRRAEIANAVERALVSFPELTQADLSDAVSAEQVWIKASALAARKREAEMAARYATRTPREDEDDEEEVRQQERAGRTPSSPRDAAPAANRRQAQEAMAGLKELEAEYERAKKARRLPYAAELYGEIALYKQQHGLS